VAKYGQEPQPEAGEFLFGPGFTTKLKNQVETDYSLSKTKSLPSHSHQFYLFMCTNHVFHPLSALQSNSFFKGAMLEIEEPNRAELTLHSTTVNSEAEEHFTQGTTTSSLHPDRRELKPASQFKESSLLLRPGHLIDSMSQTNPSWWHHQDSNDWQLCLAVFDTLNHQLGPLFAPRTNN